MILVNDNLIKEIDSISKPFVIILEVIPLILGLNEFCDARRLGDDEVPWGLRKKGRGETT